MTISSRSGALRAGRKTGRTISTLGLLLTSTALGLTSLQGAHAQSVAADLPGPAEKPAAATALNEIVVTGDSYANSATIAEKRQLNVVSDGITANQIGALPEFGLGDALAAVPGVSFVINNGRGEDQFMTIRGLNPDYNSVTVDGMVLPSTEETVRSISFDVIPATVVNSVDVLKTWTVDQPADAVGGVTALHTRSAFDHPGAFVAGDIDDASWQDQPKLHPTKWSGQGDLTLSKTFGPDNEFGALFLASYYQRSSSTLNTYTLPWSYYPAGAMGVTSAFAGSAQSATSTNSTLLPSQNVAGDLAIPDRHRWYLYDNLRTNPGAFARFDFDDHHLWHASLSGGWFSFNNAENRYSQYLNRVGQPTIASATTGSFAQGNADADYDRYGQLRDIAYANLNIGADLTPKDHINLTGNYGYGHYRQTTDEDQYLQGTSPGLGFNYNLSTIIAPLFIPNNTTFMNPALYNLTYHLDAIDRSTTHLPQARLDYTHNFDPQDMGLGYSLGAAYRDLGQTYSYQQFRFNPVGTGPTLSTVGAINATPSLYDGYGQTLLLVNPNAVASYIGANPTAFTRNASDSLSNTVNNYVLHERIEDVYAQASYRMEQFYVVAGVRYEDTREQIGNYLPIPFSSQTNFQFTQTNSSYGKLLPSLNVSYTPVKQIVIRGAITETLARPEYSQLAQNSSASVSGTVATESISNPNLKPRESTNFDLSLEAYPSPGILASVALFDKQIKNEIITTTTEQGVTVPGFATPVALTIVQPQNVNSARVDGIELNLVDSSFKFLPGMLSGFGVRGNLALMNFDAPYIRMSDGSMRHLPQLTASSKAVANAALLYNYGRVSGQLSYNFTSKQPISFDTNNAANDQWWANISTVDAQIRIKVTSHLDVRLQGKNLTDAEPQKVVGVTQQLNYSALENGRAYFAGVSFHY